MKTVKKSSVKDDKINDFERMTSIRLKRPEITGY